MITTERTQELWQGVLSALKPELKDETFNLWLKPLTVSQATENTLTIEVPNRFFSDWIKSHYQSKIESFLSEAAKTAMTLEFETKSSDEAPAIEPMDPVAYREQSGEAPAQKLLDPFGGKVNSHYEFDNFVVGPSNRFAEAAAEAVAKEPGHSYNPLFIYGGVGLGKTHLLHSIARKITGSRDNAKVRYITSEQFINEFIDALRFEKMKDFRARFRNLDCLLIDDIQFLMGKDSSQEEFFYTFNSLYDSRKQIVICSDRPPKETMVGDRLISRFEWGVIADIQPPDLETRIAILRKKSDESKVKATDDVILFVATHIKSNIRELEGSLTRIMAYCSLTGEALSIDVAKKVLKDILNGPDCATLISIDVVQKVVAHHFNLSVSDMKSKRRSDAIAFPRQIAMYLTRSLTEFSTTEIGLGFGGKDHTTVMHACNKIKNKLSSDPYFVALINKITQIIREESLLVTP